MAVGWAKATATTQHYLDTCEAVDAWRYMERSDHFIFSFNEGTEVPLAPREVHWNCEDMPENLIQECEANPCKIWQEITYIELYQKEARP